MNACARMGVTLFCSFLTVCATAALSLAESPPTTIQLEQPLHFTAADGNDVVLAPGVYQIARGAESRLALTRESAQPAIEIQAGPDTHEEQVSSPVALLAAEEGQEDEIHLVLLFPDGQSLDAVGSMSGTRSRAARYLDKRQTGHAMAMYRPLYQSQAPPRRSAIPSPLIRVPSSSGATTMLRPSAQAGQEREDTGFVPASVGTINPLSWGYLRMHAPDQIVSILKKVQTGGLRASVLEGLANPERIQALLGKPYSDQPAVTSRGLGLADAPSSASPYMVQPLPSSPTGSPVVTTPVPGTGAGAGPPSDLAMPLDRSSWDSLISPGSDQAITRINPSPYIEKPTKADFSPQQVDFGIIWDGQAPRAEIRIVVPRDGGIALSIEQNRPFRIVKASTASGLMKLIRTTPTRAILVEQEPTDSRTQPPWNFDARAGQDLWVVIEFAPHVALFGGDSAGLYQTALNVNGYNWTATVPLIGYFNGIKIGVIPMLDSHDVHVINPFHYNPNQCAVQIPQSLKLLNASQSPQAVLVEPANFPGNFSMPPVSVTVPPGGTQQVVLPITLHCLNDMGSRNFELPIKIRYAGQERQTSFTLVVYPYMYRIPTQGTVGSCKYNAEFWTYPDGNFHLTVTASTSAILPHEFDYAFYFRGAKVAGLELYLEGQAQLGTGAQKSYGFRQPGLEANYMLLFAEKPDIRLRCLSKGPF